MSEEKRKVTLSVMPNMLRERLKFYDKKMPHFAPAFDRVFVIPLEDADQQDTTAAGLHLAQETKTKMGAQRGLLVAAGAKAMEELYSMGIGLGHRVMTMRFSRWQRTYQSKEDKRFYQVLICTAGEIAASEDLYDQLEKGELFFELDVESGSVCIEDREGARERRDPAPREYGV